MNGKIRDAFDAVHAEDSLQDSTKAFLSDYLHAIDNAHNKKDNPNLIKDGAKLKSPWRRRFAAVFVCLAIVISGFGGRTLYTTPVSAISVDINPSIELGINRFDRVVTVDSYSSDGMGTIQYLYLKDLKYTDALHALLSSEEIAPYVENDGLVSVTVIGRDAKKENEIYSRISSCHYENAPNVEYHHGDRELVEEAHGAGLSFGKYRAFKELQALDPAVTSEEIRHWTIRRIRERIEELSENSTEPHNENSGKGHYDKH